MLDDRDIPRAEGAFLLRLAGFRVTPVKDGPEMLNWFFSLQEGAEPFELLLINHCRSSHEVEAVLRLLAERGVKVPLLLVRRQPLPPVPDLGSCEVCNPTEMIGRVTALVGQGRVL